MLFSFKTSPFVSYGFFLKNITTGRSNVTKKTQKTTEPKHTHTQSASVDQPKH